MTPAFDSWSAFFAMGGYGFFVWFAVIAALSALTVLVAHTILQRRALLLAVKQREARQQRIAKAQQKQSEKGLE